MVRNGELRLLHINIVSNAIYNYEDGNSCLQFALAHDHDFTGSRYASIYSFDMSLLSVIYYFPICINYERHLR